MNTGLHFDVPFEDYKAIKAANKSGLDLVARSPKHFLSAVNKATPARLLGTAIHTAILEPLEFANRFIEIPEDAPRRPTPAQMNAKKPSPDTVYACEFWTTFNRRAEGKQIISSEDYDACVRIADTLNEKPQAKEFFLTGNPEVTMVWEQDGIKCKARCDWLTEGAIVDVKSTLNADQHTFTKDIFRYGYNRQAAWYLDGYRAITGEDALFVIAAVEKEAPFESNFFYLTEEAVHLGRLENSRAFERYRQAVESNNWKGYPTELIRTEAPAWLVKQVGEL